MAALPNEAATRLETARDIRTVHINLLPTAHRAKQHRLPHINRTQLLCLAVICGVVGGTAGITWLQEQNIRSARVRVQELTAERATLEAQLQTITALRAQRADLQNRLRIIEALSQGRERAVQQAEALPLTLPGRLWLTEANFTDSSRANISGVALSPLTVADLVARLDSTNVFRNAKLVVAEAGEIDKIAVTRFTVQASLVR